MNKVRTPSAFECNVLHADLFDHRRGNDLGSEVRAEVYKHRFAQDQRVSLHLAHLMGLADVNSLDHASPSAVRRETREKFGIQFDTLRLETHPVAGFESLC